MSVSMPCAQDGVLDLDFPALHLPIGKHLMVSVMTIVEAICPLPRQFSNPTTTCEGTT